ncbi:hypothetical protein TIFTF001_020654 [Ficus carica]|uniref:Uncharacterized protein n=1 Tax=Ficus carica TaxID=3494 RepID=A0AA88AFC0_FICCA|nr:hypothetical protein TIFTF001_020654 [Ficus carica]
MPDCVANLVASQATRHSVIWGENLPEHLIAGALIAAASTLIFTNPSCRIFH